MTSRKTLLLSLALSLAAPVIAAADDEAVVELLLQQSRHRSEEVRIQALDALGGRAIESSSELRAQIIERLSEGLEDRAWKVRRAASQAFGKLGPLAIKVYVPLLERSLCDGDGDVRAAARAALARLGSPLPSQLKEIKPLLSDSRWTLRRAAAQAIGGMGAKGRGALAELIEAAGDPDSDVRQAVAAALREIEALAGDFPVLVRALKSRRPGARIVAIQRLQACARKTVIVRESPRELPHFLAAMEDSEWRVRREACRAIASLGERGVSAFLPLFDRSFDLDSDVRQAARSALAAVGAPRAAAIPGLIKRAADARWSVRRKAIRALGLLVNDNRAALPAILKANGDSDNDVRTAAVAALARVELGPADTAVLCSAAAEGSTHGRCVALRALGQVGAKTTEAALLREQISVLASALEDSAWRVRQAACQSLDRLDGRARSLYIKLLQRLSDSDVDVRRAAAGALNGLAPTRDHVSELLTMLKDPRWKQRRLAALHLARLERREPGAERALEQVAARDRDNDVRRAAKQALASLRSKPDMRWF